MDIGGPSQAKSGESRANGAKDLSYKTHINIIIIVALLHRGEISCSEVTSPSGYRLDSENTMKN